MLYFIEHEDHNGVWANEDAARKARAKGAKVYRDNVDWQEATDEELAEDPCVYAPAATAQKVVCSPDGVQTISALSVEEHDGIMVARAKEEEQDVRI